MRYMVLLTALVTAASFNGNGDLTPAMVASAAGQKWFEVDLTAINRDQLIGPVIGRGEQVTFHGGVRGFGGKVVWTMIQITDDGHIKWHIHGSSSHGGGWIRNAEGFPGQGVRVYRSDPEPAAPGDRLIATSTSDVSLDSVPADGYWIGIGTDNMTTEQRH